MKHALNLSIIAVLMAVVLDCGRKVMVPPRIDLKQHEVIGILEFTSSSEGKLGPYTTKKFMDMARQDQEMVRIVEMGSEAKVLKAIGHKMLDQDAYKALREKYDAATIITGELIISDVRPNISIGLLFSDMTFKAEVDATLNVQMIETVTGASIWSTSASATKEIGHVSIFGGKYFIFDAEDPDKAYGKLVNVLVEIVTKDFRVTWVRKKD